MKEKGKVILFLLLVIFLAVEFLFKVGVKYGRQNVL